jgi:endogenous inhibitor of DNA gyrase (YacG/DUF329 family)
MPSRAARASGLKSSGADYIDLAMPLDSRISEPEARRPCPICGKPETPRSRPFCSRRCAHIDLGRWLKGSYRIPTDEQPEEDSEAP